MPICSRCKTAEIAGSCIYSAQDPKKSSKWRIAAIATLHPVSKPKQPDHSSRQRPSTSLTSAGSLGVTSYRHAMSEAGSKMSPSQVENDPSEPDVSSHNLQESSLMANDKFYSAAMRALRGSPERTLAHDLFGAYINYNDCWSRLAARRLHCSFWDTFGTYLDGERSIKSPLQLATMLSENSSKPLRKDYSDSMQWLERFSGRNMRWEGLGVLSVYWAHGANSIRQGPEDKSVPSANDFQHPLRYKDYAWDIIDLTRNMTSSNTLFLCFIYEQSSSQVQRWMRRWWVDLTVTQRRSQYDKKR